MSVQCVAIFWVVSASSGEKSCLQFSIPTGSGAGGEGGVSHRLETDFLDLQPGMQQRQNGLHFGPFSVLPNYVKKIE